MYRFAQLQCISIYICQPPFLLCPRRGFARSPARSCTPPRPENWSVIVPELLRSYLALSEYAVSCLEMFRSDCKAKRESQQCNRHSRALSRCCAKAHSDKLRLPAMLASRLAFMCTPAVHRCSKQQLAVGHTHRHLLTVGIRVHILSRRAFGF